jgi:ribosomal protein L21E
MRKKTRLGNYRVGDYVFSLAGGLNDSKHPKHNTEEPLKSNEVVRLDEILKQSHASDRYHVGYDSVRNIVYYLEQYPKGFREATSEEIKNYKYKYEQKEDIMFKEGDKIKVISTNEKLTQDNGFVVGISYDVIKVDTRDNTLNTSNGWVSMADVEIIPTIKRTDIKVGGFVKVVSLNGNNTKTSFKQGHEGEILEVDYNDNTIRLTTHHRDNWRWANIEDVEVIEKTTNKFKEGDYVRIVSTEGDETKHSFYEGQEGKVLGVDYSDNTLKVSHPNDNWQWANMVDVEILEQVNETLSSGMEFYLMERQGMFQPSESTANQCKDVGHKYYEYKCKIYFDPSTKLDDDDFLIDHAEIDKTIQECNPLGSCEGMHKKIMSAIVKRFETEKVETLAIKVTITPKYPVGMANLTYIKVKDKAYVGLVS